MIPWPLCILNPKLNVISPVFLQNTLEVVVEEEDLAVFSPSPNLLPPIRDVCNSSARYATECNKKSA